MFEWIINRTDSKKYPYLIKIIREKDVVFEFLTRASWPGEGQQVFCIRSENSSEKFTILSQLEKYPIKNISRRGKILSVVIERPQRKRCEFLFIEKRYKTKEGTYEQIFWRAQSFFKEKGSRIRRLPTGKIKVLIDINERYAYEFPAYEKKKLPVGDYAVEREGKLLGVVERKTFSDFLSSLSRINNLHLLFTELSSYPHSAVIVEAPYHYFLNSTRVKPLTPSLCENAIHELMIEHPRVHLMFLDNRKVARLFCESFLKQAFYKTSKLKLSFSGMVENKRSYEDPEEFMMIAREFTFSELCKSFPQRTKYNLRSLLNKLRFQGKVVCVGRGINAKWVWK